jgi:16S rRNA (guanine966-N2)-methyltransferase
MRVIAGTLRGRLLAAPRGMSTRPITDRVKETLFNILGHRFGQPGGLPACDVLDAFAGTGGLGIEALSRGARTCVFVEHDRRALHCLRANIRALGLDACCTVLTDNAWTMRPPQTPEGFGLVVVDPPYRDSADPLRVADLLERLAPRLAPDGLIVLRQETMATFPVQELRAIRCTDERTIGHMRLLFLGLGPA